MEKLASLFISTVLLANSIAPAAQIPQVLGVKTEESSVAQESLTQRTIQQIRNTVNNEALQTAIQERQEIREQLETRRQQALDEAQYSRNLFRERLANVKEERVRKILENMTIRFGAYNTKWTDNWNEALSRIVEVLAKAEAKADELEDQGYDVSDLRVSISEAKESIDNAQTMINEQIEKSYYPDLEDIDNLGNEMSTLVDNYREDLQEVRKSVVDAKQSVNDVVTELRSLLEENN